jgi:hypothetical protein
MVTKVETTPASQLLSLARQVDAAKNKWKPTLDSSGELDEGSYLDMVQKRQELVCTPPDSPLDAVIILQAIRCVSAFMYSMTLNSPTITPEAKDIMVSGIIEVQAGIDGVRAYLEGQAGIDFASLGLFSDESVALQ